MSCHSKLLPQTHKLYMSYFLMYCEGCTVEQIAKERFISKSAVKWAFQRLREEYKAKHSAHLLKLCIDKYTNIVKTLTEDTADARPIPTLF